MSAALTVQRAHEPADPLPTDLSVILSVEEVQRPDGYRWTQNVITIRTDAPGAMAYVTRPEDGAILLVRMYRHVLGGYGWELPGGRGDAADADETVTAVREVLEETGYSPAGPARTVGWVSPMTGMVQYRFAVVRFEVAPGAVPVAVDNEVAAVGWFTPAQVAEMVRSGEIACGSTLSPLAIVAAADGPA